MKLCERCKKNVAVVYTTKLENGKQTSMGLCIPCAKELGIQPIDQVMDQMKMSEEDYKNLNEQMMQLFQNIDQDELQEAMQGMMTMDPESMENNPIFQQFQSMMGNEGFESLEGPEDEDEEEEKEDDEDEESDESDTETFKTRKSRYSKIHTPSRPEPKRYRHPKTYGCRRYCSNSRILIRYGNIFPKHHT